MFLQIWYKGVNYIFAGQTMEETSRSNEGEPLSFLCNIYRDELNDSCMMHLLLKNI